MTHPTSPRAAAQLLVAVALLSGVLACGEDPLGPEDVDLTGEWSGLTQNIGLDLTLQESETGSLSGEGKLSGSRDSFPFTVKSGNHSGNGFRMILAFPDVRDDVRYEGDVVVSQTEDETETPPRVQLEGTLTGSGFSEFQMTLTR